MITWFNFLSLSYPAGTLQVSWGKKEGLSEKQTECLLEQVLHFVKRPPKQQRRNSLGNMPSLTLQKRTMALQIFKKLFIGLHFSLTS